ncbi:MULTISPECIES: zinc-binding metallopeptidase family protein [Maribacter]|uniref:Zinc-binding peptidase n=1 Tax=Maribacter flavus TaxID=1658664 RepID=A0ABU7IFP2_9FLAO|nr:MULTISPECIES: putative zinc-binding peptidase [Maribacter]MDC6404612.1 putative zinc-binding peptidase [Maribacter sp. PR66]MEE1971755.1 putative zinc-binding peptidase [Maribacter flavus]
MKLFQCSNCGNSIVFENNRCVSCGYYLAYSSFYNQMVSLSPNLSQWNTSSLGDGQYKYCVNSQHGTCNWLVPLDSPSGFCLACSLNRTIPDLSIIKNQESWKKIELAKHRLVYQLLRLRLPIFNKKENFVEGLCFDFLSPKNRDNLKTGHANGVITILISEADSVVREKVKQNMEERYRTMLGHFRHEVGHYYWDVLIRNDKVTLSNFREVFGDESISYENSLQNYYTNGPRHDWQNFHISKYASSHAWEDWAETWSHYLHLMDTLETAYNFGLQTSPKLKGTNDLDVNANFDPYMKNDFQAILRTAIPLFYTLNSMNRSMGKDDAYPFVISEPVKSKLTFIHNLLIKGKGF